VQSAPSKWYGLSARTDCRKPRKEGGNEGLCDERPNKAGSGKFKWVPGDVPRTPGMCENMTSSLPVSVFQISLTVALNFVHAAHFPRVWWSLYLRPFPSSLPCCIVYVSDSINTLRVQRGTRPSGKATKQGTMWWKRVLWQAHVFIPAKTILLRAWLMETVLTAETRHKCDGQDLSIHIRPIVCLQSNEPSVPTIFGSVITHMAGIYTTVFASPPAMIFRNFAALFRRRVSPSKSNALQ
jgi:hypothetical protein